MATHNMDLQARNRTLRAGVVVVGLTLCAAVTFNLVGAAIGFRALLFLPFFFAAYAITSALYGTCSFSAMRGRRLAGGGSEPMCNRQEVRANVRRGLGVLIGALVVSGAATVLLLV